MRIMIVKDNREILRKRFSPIEQCLGVISVEHLKHGTEFIVRVLDVNHLRYHYSPKTKKFEVQFLSLKRELEGKRVKNNEKLEHNL